MKTLEQLDRAVDNPVAQVQAAMEEYTPLAKPNPYSKRWFTTDVKIQQKEVNRLH